jgi:hypothetical protein
MRPKRIYSEKGLRRGDILKIETPDFTAYSVILNIKNRKLNIADDIDDDKIIEENKIALVYNILVEPSLSTGECDAILSHIFLSPKYYEVTLISRLPKEV